MTTHIDNTQLDSACSESVFYVVDIGRDGRPLHGPRKIPASVELRAKLAQFRSGFSTHLIYALREVPLAIGWQSAPFTLPTKGVSPQKEGSQGGNIPQTVLAAQLGQYAFSFVL